jgi:peroxiredoxin
MKGLLFWLKLLLFGGRPVPDVLQPGQPLPDFEAVDEHGTRVRSADLAGKPTAMLFVRGNWCPFCNRQVHNLTRHYRDITEMGARLIFVTPKPLETTRRVAQFFQVEFDFWLDEDLAIARKLGLLLEDGVPASYEKEYGHDTHWPAALVVDAAGVIRYAKLSKRISDRPDPRELLTELRRQ